MEAGAIQQGSGCIPNKLESNICQFFPPFGSNRESCLASSTIPSSYVLSNLFSNMFLVTPG